MWIISDLHISDSFSLVDKSSIERILDFLKSRQPDKIIFNGDIFDFARVYNIPTGYIPSNTEIRYGLESSEQNAFLKMKMIIESNQYFFDGLRELIERGFDLIFLYGNHDSELRYKSVQSLIIEELNVNQNRLFFGLTYNKDGIYVEHGHQHDPENRIVYADDNLPVEEYSFGYVTSRYFGNIIERERRLPRNDISAGEYFIWVFKNFGFKAFKFIFQYFVYSIIVLNKSGKKFILRNKYKKDDHFAIPIMSSLIMTIKRLYLVQVSFFIVFFMSLILTLLIKPAHFYFPALGFLICLIPLFSINNKNRVDRILNSASKNLRQIYNVDKIVFGHNHYSKIDKESNYLSSTPQIINQNIFILHVSSSDSSYLKI